jgi:hypothetical protein
MDTMFQQMNKDSVVIEFAPSTSILNEMMKKVGTDPEVNPSKENYFVLPKDMDKCLKYFTTA